MKTAQIVDARPAARFNAQADEPRARHIRRAKRSVGFNLREGEIKAPLDELQ